MTTEKCLGGGASIGPVTAKTMEENGIKPAGIARTYTIDGLIDVISERLGESIES